MTEPTHSGARCGASTEHLWYEVIVNLQEGYFLSVFMAEASDYIKANCSRGEWEFDWTSIVMVNVSFVIKNLRYLFQIEEDAAMFKMRFG
jgi:hypothetical protein